MIKIQGTLPKQLGVAVSGGVDSMAVLDFLRRQHSVTAYFFDHGTVHGLDGRSLVSEYCEQHNIPMQIGQLINARNKKTSMEEHWRNERYEWFRQQDDVIVTGHHLDDCVETWVFNTCHGNSWTIPYAHANVIRPFRLNPKRNLEDWAHRHQVPWVHDPSNGNVQYARNRIRHCVMPELLQINPGLPKVIKKRIADENIQ
jgi:tRNA(Ile)-lysidine synthase